MMHSLSVYSCEYTLSLWLFRPKRVKSVKGSLRHLVYAKAKVFIYSTEGDSSVSF